MAPMIGATMNNHSCSSAAPPANNAWLMLLAGLTDVLVTGILIRWIKVNIRPMAKPANPFGARSSVAPRMTIKNMKVITISVIKAAVML